MDCLTAYEEFRRSSDHRERVRALNFMVTSKCRRDAHRLFEGFSEQEEHFQCSIIFAQRFIANMRSKKLLVALASDRTLKDSVRAALAEAIGDLGLTECKQTILEQLRHPSPVVRFWSCECLAFIGDLYDINHIEELLSDSAIGWSGTPVSACAKKAIESIKNRE